MAMVKAVTIHPVFIDQFDVPKLPVVVPADQHHPGPQLPEFIDEANCCRLGQAAVDHVTDDHQGLRLVIRNQFSQAAGNRIHTPERNQPAACALAHFIAEMEVGDRHPTLSDMK